MKIQIEINWQPFVAATESAARIIADAIRDAVAPRAKAEKVEAPTEVAPEEESALVEMEFIPGMRSFRRKYVRITNLKQSVAIHTGLTYKEVSEYVKNYSRYFRNSNGRGMVVSSEDATKIRLELIKKIKAKAVK